MSKNKLKNLVHYSCTFFIPLLILLICILNTFTGTGQVDHIYTSISVNIETGFTNFHNICTWLDILNVEGFLTNMVHAVADTSSVVYNVTIYLRSIFSWFGWVLTFEIVHLCYDIVTFIIHWFECKIGGLR